MTNYERICADKAFCAWVLADVEEFGSDKAWLQWLDAEQREVSDEREQEVNHE